MNIFLIESPLQAIAAAEAKSQFKIESNDLVVIKLEKKQHRSYLQLEKSLKYGNWSKVIKITNSSQIMTKIKSFILYTFIKIKLSHNVHKVFIGDYRSKWMHRVAEISKSDEVFLLDDGVVTVTIQKQFLKKGKFNPLKSSPKLSDLSLIEIIEVLLFRALGSTGSEDYVLNLFTAFRLESELHPYQKIVKNEYENIRNYNVRKSSEELFYFGTKYSEAGFFSLKTEIEFLQKVFLYLGQHGHKVVYIPHREDSKEKLEKIQKILCITILETDLPAEVYFVENGIELHNIAAAFSTAAINLSIIYNNCKVTFFRLPIEKISEEKRALAVDSYTFYEDRGFTVIDLN